MLADDVDDAQALEEEQRADAIRAASRPRSRGQGPLYWRDGVALCADCEEPIGVRRLESHPDASRCVVCQETYERESGG